MADEFEVPQFYETTLRMRPRGEAEDPSREFVFLCAPVAAIHKDNLGLLDNPEELRDTRQGGTYIGLGAAAAAIVPHVAVVYLGVVAAGILGLVVAYSIGVIAARYPSQERGRQTRSRICGARSSS